MNNTVICISNRELVEIIAGVDDADFVSVYPRAAYITDDGDVEIVVDYEENYDDE